MTTPPFEKPAKLRLGGLTAFRRGFWDCRYGRPFNEEIFRKDSPLWNNYLAGYRLADAHPGKYAHWLYSDRELTKLAVQAAMAWAKKARAKNDATREQIAAVLEGWKLLSEKLKDRKKDADAQ